LAYRPVDHHLVETGGTALKQKIVNFDKDELGDWRARLECGHFQHLRHDPPLTTRFWILDEAERQKKVGAELDCKKCDDLTRSGS